MLESLANLIMSGEYFSMQGKNSKTEWGEGVKENGIIQLYDKKHK